MTVTQTSTGAVAALGVIGADVFGDTTTGDLAALIANPAIPFPNLQLLGFNFTFDQEISVEVVPTTFTSAGATAEVLAQGSALTTITNSALLSLVGVDELGLTLVDSIPLGSDTTVNGYLLTAITPASSLPEPLLVPFVGVAFAGLFAMRFFVRRRRA